MKATLFLRLSIRVPPHVSVRVLAPSFDPGARQWVSDDALLAEGGDLFGRDAQPRAEDVLDMLTELR